MRLATWNVNSLNARLPRVEEWVASVAPDVVCLQETKLADDAFPTLTFEALGYTVVAHGEGRWNGVAVLSRVGADDPVSGLGDAALDDEARCLTVTCAGVRVISVYVPNGRDPAHEQYAYKLRWLEGLRRRVEAELAGHPVVVMGDWNVAPDDRDVWSTGAMAGSTHVTAPEREALAAIADLGLRDVFRELHPEEGLFSWWDYRAGRFHKREGLRIDYALMSAELADRVEVALVDRNARKGKLPSDHAPVVYDLRDPSN